MKKLNRKFINLISTSFRLELGWSWS